MNKTLLIIIGAGHSGSTLLAKTLNAHSEIFALSEISNFEEDIIKDISLCGCGENIHDCPFWEHVNQELMKTHGVGIKQYPRGYNLRKERGSFYSKLRFYGERNLAVNFNMLSKHYRTRLQNMTNLYEVVFKLTEAKILVDSSKTAKRALLIKNYLKNKYDIKIIHLVRDGRAVLYSYSKGYYEVKIRNAESGKIEMKRFYAESKKSLSEIVKLWINDNMDVYRYHKPETNPEYYFMRYEDFANDPENQLISLLKHLNLHYEPEMLNLNRLQNHMVAGNASRINAETIQKPSEKWKTGLSKKQLEYFDKSAKKYNQKLGYQL